MTNFTIIDGYLGADPVYGKSEANGTAWASFRIAVNESWRDRDGHEQKRTTWVPVYTFNGLAKTVEHLAKGDRVLVQGKLRNDARTVGEVEIQTLKLEARAIEFIRVKKFENAE